MDDTEKFLDVCFSPLVPISNTSSVDNDDATENQQIENSNIKYQIPTLFSKFKFNEKLGLNVEVDKLNLI